MTAILNTYSQVCTQHYYQNLWFCRGYGSNTTTEWPIALFDDKRENDLWRWLKRKRTPLGALTSLSAITDRLGGKCSHRKKFSGMSGKSIIVLIKKKPGSDHIALAHDLLNFLYMLHECFSNASPLLVLAISHFREGSTSSWQLIPRSSQKFFAEKNQ